MAKLLTLLSALLVVIAITVIDADTESSTIPPPKTPPPTTTAPTTTTTTPTTTTTTTVSTPSTTPSPSPSTSSTTPSPSPSTSSTTPSPSPSTTTLSPPTTTEAPNPCVPNPCGDGSTCEVRFNQSIVCLCLPGDSYNYETSSCQRAKVFPGQLTLPGLTYTEEMSDKTSQAFEDASMKITLLINNASTEAGFSDSRVLELRKSNTRLASSSGVEALVELIFEANALATKETARKQIEKASDCDDCVLKGSSFAAKDLCDFKPCNEHTTNCESKDGGFSCSCADGYISTAFSNRICLECPSGTKANVSECVDCPFGQTGFNCEDNRLLIVVIVASVVGGLLLITLILLPIIAVKTKNKTPKAKNEDYGKPYVSHSVAKAPPANSNMQNGHSSSFHGSTNEGPSNVGVPRIPRATTTSNWDSRTNLEMMPSNSRQNLIPSGKNTRMDDDYDEAFTYDQPQTQSNPYSQNLPQRNPYAQNRAINPYAQSQGNSNPYYM